MLTPLTLLLSRFLETADGRAADGRAADGKQNWAVLLKIFVRPEIGFPLKNVYFIT